MLIRSDAPQPRYQLYVYDAFGEVPPRYSRTVRSWWTTAGMYGAVARAADGATREELRQRLFPTPADTKTEDYAAFDAHLDHLDDDAAAAAPPAPALIPTARGG
jgi:hypothetical protein